MASPWKISSTALEKINLDTRKTMKDLKVDGNKELFVMFSCLLKIFKEFLPRIFTYLSCSLVQFSLH